MDDLVGQMRVAEDVLNSLSVDRPLEALSGECVMGTGASDCACR